MAVVGGLRVVRILQEGQVVQGEEYKWGRRGVRVNAEICDPNSGLPSRKAC